MEGESRVDPSTLQGRHRSRKDKEARLASVLEGTGTWIILHACPAYAPIHCHLYPVIELRSVSDACIGPVLSLHVRSYHR